MRTIIHELMHLPKSFGGGFRFHDHVTRKNADVLFKRSRAAMRRRAAGATS